VADGKDILGVIELKDVVKQGIHEKFDQMRQMGIRTGHDHRRQPVDCGRPSRRKQASTDYLAEATPEAKMALIKPSKRAASSSP